MHHCDFLQFVVHYHSQVLLIESFDFNFRSQYVLLGLTSCNNSNIKYYTVILCHKLVFLVLVRLIAITVRILIVWLIVIKIFNQIAALKITRNFRLHCFLATVTPLLFIVYYGIIFFSNRAVHINGMTISLLSNIINGTSETRCHTVEKPHRHTAFTHLYTYSNWNSSFTEIPSSNNETSCHQTSKITNGQTTPKT